MPTLILPPMNVLATAAAELASVAFEAGDKANENAINKAMLQLHTGCVPIATTGGFLIESRTRGGVVHRVSNVYGCNCEGGRAGRACWHSSLLEIVEAAQTRAIPLAVTREQAARDMAELFN